MKVKVFVAHSGSTLWDPMDCSLPGSSSVYGILQARILEWLAILFSRASSRPRDQTWVSCTADGFFINSLLSQAPGRPITPRVNHNVNCGLQVIIMYISLGSSIFACVKNCNVKKFAPLRYNMLVVREFVHV